MAIVVEDGNGLSNAESYGSVAEADTYWAAHGSPSEWTDATVLQTEAALRYGTQWLDNNYNYYSSIKSSTQALGFPRLSYYDSEGRQIAGDSVPVKMKHATFEMALQWLKDNFASTDREGVVAESIGSASVTYGSGVKSFSYVKSLLRDYGTPNKAKNATLYRA